MSSKCEMLEMSKSIAARLILNCIQGLEDHFSESEDKVIEEHSISSSI